MSSADPLVSVVIPLFNGAPYIAETLERALTQAHQRVEIVVVDDASTDNGPSIVSKFAAKDSRVRLIRKAHTGIAATRNVGITHASNEGAFFLFLDQDDVIDSTFLVRLIELLELRPDAVGARALADYVDSAGEPLMKGHFAAQMRRRLLVRKGVIEITTEETDYHWLDLFLFNTIYPPSACLLRAESVREVGGFDQHYQVADDWDMMIRISRGGPILSLNEVLVGYRRHSLNASGNRTRNVAETRAVWSRTYYSDENTAQARADLKRLWRWQQRRSAKAKWHEGLRAARERRPVRFLVMTADGLAHTLLWRPLKVWRR